MNVSLPRHRCEHRDCPSFGQPTYAGACRCHKTPEQMLLDQRAELAELVQEMRECLPTTRPSLVRLAARAEAALNRMEGRSNG